MEKQTKKNFKLGNEYNEAFKELKGRLCLAPILALPNFGASAQPFLSNTEASDVVVSGIISQRDKEGRENVIAHAITGISKKM